MQKKNKQTNKLEHMNHLSWKLIKISQELTMILESEDNDIKNHYYNCILYDLEAKRII